MTSGILEVGSSSPVAKFMHSNLSDKIVTNNVSATIPYHQTLQNLFHKLLFDYQSWMAMVGRLATLRRNDFHVQNESSWYTVFVILLLT
jgi:hypothetical protein